VVEQVAGAGRKETSWRHDPHTQDQPCAAHVSDIERSSILHGHPGVQGVDRNHLGMVSSATARITTRSDSCPPATGPSPQGQVLTFHHMALEWAVWTTVQGA